MSDDTFESRTIGDVYDSGPVRQEWTVVGEAGIKPGYAIRIGTDGKAYLDSSADGPAAGIAGCADGHDLDTAYSVGDLIPYYPVGYGITVWAFLLGGAGAAMIGDAAIVSATDGILTNFSYTDGVENTDTLILKIGKWASYDAGHATDKHLVKVTI